MNLNRIRLVLLSLFLLAASGVGAGTISIPFPGPGSASPKLSVSWITYGTFTSGASPSWSLSIGTAASDRYIVVAIAGYAGNVSGRQSLSSVTIGGVAATQIYVSYQNFSSNARTTTAWYGLSVPTGTTSTIQVNWSGSIDSTSVSVYRVTGSGSPTLSGSGVASNGTASPSVSLTIPTGGIGLGICTSGNGGSVTWTGLTEDLDINGAPYPLISTASSSSAGTATRSAAMTAGTTDNGMSAIAMQP